MGGKIYSYCTHTGLPRVVCRVPQLHPYIKYEFLPLNIVKQRFCREVGLEGQDGGGGGGCGGMVRVVFGNSSNIWFVEMRLGVS
jgi:hypothetical protein